MKVLALCFFLFIISHGLSSREKRSIGPSLPSVANDTLSVIPYNNSNEVQINCTFYNTSIWITYAFLQNNVTIQNIDSVAFLNQSESVIPGCRHNVTSSQDIHITLEQFGECAYRVKNFGNITNIDYKICVFPKAPVAPIYHSRDMPTVIALTCPYVSGILGELVLKPQTRKTELPVENESGQFEVKFVQCTNASCNSFNSTDVVIVGSPTFIGLEICDGQNLNLILQVINCWATSTSDSNDNLRYDIIQGGCPVSDATFHESNQIYTNYQSYKAIFSFVAFFWTRLSSSEQFIFLHCDVLFCSPSIENCTAAAPFCSSQMVGKRSTSENTFPNIERASYGPIEIKSCNKVQLGCSHECAVSENDLTPYCVCPDGYKLSSDLKTCKDFRNALLKEKESIDSPDEVDYIEITYEENPDQHDINNNLIENLTYLFYGIIAGMVMASAVFYLIIRKKSDGIKQQAVIGQI